MNKLKTRNLSAIIARIIEIDPVHPRVAILEKLMLRRVNIETFVDAPGRRNAFFMIEKVSAERPKSLFGQPVDSLAHSRISLFAGRAEGSAWVAGEHIISWDISDQALARMTLESNTWKNHPMTVSMIGGAALDDYVSEKPDFRAMMNEQTKRISDRYGATLREARSKLASGGKPTKTQLEHLAVAMRNLNRGDNANFVLEQHMKNITKTRIALEFEIIAAATQVASPTAPGLTPAPGAGSDKGRESAEEGAGEGVGEGASEITDRSRNPIWDAVCSQYSPEEEDAMADGIEALLSHSLTAIAGAPLNYDVKGDSHAKSLRSILARAMAGKPLPDEAKEAEFLSKLHNTFYNNHVLKNRRAAKPRECGCSIVRVHGFHNHLHSAYANDNTDDIIRMSVETAVETKSFGVCDIDGVEDLIQIDISYEDFMSALRDGILGHRTPCTLSRLFGLPTREIAAPVSETTQIMDTVDDAMSVHEAELKDIIARMDHLIRSGGLSTKADRAAALALVDEALKIYDTYSDTMMDAVSAKAENLEASVKDSIRRKFEALPMLGEKARESAIRLITAL